MKNVNHFLIIFVIIVIIIIMLSDDIKYTLNSFATVDGEATNLLIGWFALKVRR